MGSPITIPIRVTYGQFQSGDVIQKTGTAASIGTTTAPDIRIRLSTKRKAAILIPYNPARNAINAIEAENQDSVTNDRRRDFTRASESGECRNRFRTGLRCTNDCGSRLIDQKNPHWVVTRNRIGVPKSGANILERGHAIEEKSSVGEIVEQSIRVQTRDEEFFDEAD